MMRETTWRRTTHLWETILGVGGTVVVAFVLARAPLFLAATLFAAIGLVLGGIAWPPLVLPAIAIAVPFGPGIPLDAFTLGSTDLLIGLGVGIWLARHWARRQWPPLSGTFLPPLLLYLSALLLSLSSAWSWRAALPELAKWVEIAAFYVVALGMLRSFSTSRLLFIVAGSLVLAATAQALVGLVQFFLQIGPPGFIILGRFMRAHGTFAQPNPYAGYLGLVFPLALSLSLYSLGHLSRSWASWRGWLATAKPFLLWATATLIIAAGLLASWSRAGWLAMVAAAGVVLLLRSRRALGIAAISLFIGGAFGVLGLINALPAAITQRFAGLEDWTLFLRPDELRLIPVTSANFALIERMAHWWAAWAMWLDHPLTGVGVGNYPVAYDTYRLPGWRDPLGHAHNILLNALAETGLVGLVAYIALWAWVFIWGFRRVKQVQGRERAILLGALGGLTHLTVHNLFDNLYVHGMYAYVALLLALVEITGAAARSPKHLPITPGEVTGSHEGLLGRG